MKKTKRYLKPVLEKILEFILITMVMLTLCVDDFVWAWSTLVFAICWFAIIYILFKILKTYGREFQKWIEDATDY